MIEAVCNIKLSTPSHIIREGFLCVKLVYEKYVGKRKACQEENMGKRVAVIGLGCKFAGAEDVDSLWHLLENGQCEFSEMSERFKDYRSFYNADTSVKGKAYNERAAFLKHDIYMFDADFFEISDSEARKMDIQQRLLLETSYEALEDAGISVSGSCAGVFIGGFMQDALTNIMHKQNYYNLNGYDATGISNGMLANKISYFYDLHGPSISIDTACSSSLTALHYACQSIIEGECCVAICGGVNILSELGNFITLSKGGFLSSKSLCHAFGEEADGYARGEGAGVLIIKDLEQALVDGDKIYCEILATHINHDGRTNGITLPNPDTQVELLRTVMKKAGVGVDDISYLEAHGTGTQAGDKAEMLALARVFDERKEKLIVGSVKTNIGHTEAAAGIAGMIKGILILENNLIPKTLHSEIKNHNIPFEKYPLQLAESLIALPEIGKSCVGVNSFGFGGVNVHAIISKVKKLDLKMACGITPTADDGRCIFMLSARSRESLKTLVYAYTDTLERGLLSKYSLRDICGSAAIRRRHWEHRLAIVSESKDMLVHDLKCFVNDIDRKSIYFKQCNPKKNNKCVFVFSGMGVQSSGMGVELYNNFAQFRDTFGICSDVFLKISGIDLKTIIMRENIEYLYDNVEILQPFNLAYQISLFTLAKSLGVKYTAITGHSAGEMAAFYCGGLVTMEHIFKVAYHRSRIQQKLNGKGKMLVLSVTKKEAQDICSEYGDKISLAVVNGKQSVVLSGDSNILLEIHEKMVDKNIFSRFLNGGIAYHSSQMDLFKSEFMEAFNLLQNDTDTKSKVDVYSTVLGRKLDNEEYESLYWWENIRGTVEFKNTVDQLARDGYRVFIEVGPSGALGYYISEYFEGSGAEYTYTALQDRKLGQIEAIYKAVSVLYCSAAAIDQNVLYSGAPWLPLPKYTWSKKHLKPIITYDQYVNDKLDKMLVLGSKLNFPYDVWESRMNLSVDNWISGHKIDKDILFPAAGYIQMMLESGTNRICYVSFLSPAVFTDYQDLIFNFTKLDSRKISISSSGFLRDEWNKHCIADIMLIDTRKENCERVDIEDLRNKICTSYEKDSIYAILAVYSFCYEDGFRVLDNAHIGEDFVLAEVNQEHDHVSGIYIMDGMFQALALANKDKISRARNNLYLPQQINDITFFAEEYGQLYIYAKIIKKEFNAIMGDAFLLNSAGDILTSMKGIRLSVMPKTTIINYDTTNSGTVEVEYLKNDTCFQTSWEEINVEVSEEDYEGVYIYYATDDYVKDCIWIINKVKEIREIKSTLVIVTTCALKVLDTDKVQNYNQAALWGLCRCVQHEYGSIIVRLIDTDVVGCMNWAEFSAGLGQETELAVRNGKVYGMRIIRQDLLHPSRIDGTIVITGASGGLAYNLILELAERGIDGFVLISRRFTRQTQILADILLHFDIKAKFYTVDVSDYNSLSDVWKLITEDLDLLTVKHIYHLAGMSKDAMIINIDEAILHETFAPKISGSRNLFRLMKNSGLVQNGVVLHLAGSIVGLLGNTGQGAYGAANAVLDSFCAYVNGKGGCCQLLGFGALNTGMTIKAGITQGFNKQSIYIMNAPEAVSLSLACKETHIYIMKINWEQFLKQTNQLEASRFQYLNEMEQASDMSLVNKIALMPYEDQITLLCNLLMEAYATVLETDSASFDPARSTNSLGINSLNSVLVSNHINRQLGTELFYGQVVGDFSIKELAVKILNMVCPND